MKHRRRLPTAQRPTIRISNLSHNLNIKKSIDLLTLCQSWFQVDYPTLILLTHTGSLNIATRDRKPLKALNHFHRSPVEASLLENIENHNKPGSRRSSCLAIPTKACLGRPLRSGTLETQDPAKRSHRSLRTQKIQGEPEPEPER